MLHFSRDIRQDFGLYTSAGRIDKNGYSYSDKKRNRTEARTICSRGIVRIASQASDTSSRRAIVALRRARTRGDATNHTALRYRGAAGNATLSKTSRAYRRRRDTFVETTLTNDQFDGRKSRGYRVGLHQYETSRFSQRRRSCIVAAKERRVRIAEASEQTTHVEHEWSDVR